MPSPHRPVSPRANDPTAARLSRTFDRALSLSLAAVAAGCEPAWPERSDGFEPVSCDPLADLAPAAPADFVALRERRGGAGGAVTEIAALGTPCARAADVARCQAALAATDGLPPSNGVGVDEAVVRYLTTTHGDEVARHHAPEQLLPFLGAIDRPNEAVLMARIASYTIDCSTFARAAVRAVSGGYEVVGTKMTKICAPIEKTKFLLDVTSEGALSVIDREVYDRDSACVGRRPPGLVLPPSCARGRALGRFFARAAELEAASVHAFRVLARELAALGADASLVRRASLAASDEIRHARSVGRLARRFGAEPGSVRVAPRALRSALAIARDNAVEGCVRETFGALFGRFQAEHAADLEVRAALAAIGDDETRHASLAWDIAGWLEPRLSPRERADVALARREAVAVLRAELAQTPDVRELETIAGVPGRRAATRLVETLEAELWAAPPVA